MKKEIKAIQQLVVIFSLFLLAGLTTPVESQAQSYEISPMPDIWYNSVDGVRIGARIRGEEPGSFGEGPHRLDAGVWLGTKIPTYPASYYFSFTEPIPSISDYSNEGSIEIESAYRTGFQHHGLNFNKRWQQGFEETNYTELVLGLRAEKRFSHEYLLYPQFWQDEWLYLFSIESELTNEGVLGRYHIYATADMNLLGNYDEFIRGDVVFEQKIPLSESFSLYGRLYSGFASANTAVEYLFARSFSSPRNWVKSGLTRARGTIPPIWFRSGAAQITGGANIRGYTYSDLQQLESGFAPFFTSISSINTELNFFNPLQNIISDIPLLGEFSSLRSYLFFDGGTSLGITDQELSDELANAGAGFELSLNIPGNRGKMRGFVIRYDMPLWLSNPGSEASFKFRNIIGFGGVFSL